MDPAGMVYPCLTLDRAMGNIRGRGFEEIWESTEAQAARAAVSRCAEPCWMICTARTAMLRRPDAPARGILASWHRLATGRRVD